MTEHNLSREQAAAAAQAGAKVRHESWDEGGATANPKGYRHSVYATGWSIVTPAPDTAKPETDRMTDAEIADVVERLALSSNGLHFAAHRAIHQLQSDLISVCQREAATQRRQDDKLDALEFATTRTIPLDDVRGEGTHKIIDSPNPNEIGKCVTVSLSDAFKEINALKMRVIALESPEDFGPGSNPLEPAKPQPATEANPHPEGSRKWAKFEMKRGRKVLARGWNKGGIFTVAWQRRCAKQLGGCVAVGNMGFYA